MQYLKNIIEFLFSAGLFINAILFIPQAIRIFREKNATGVSLLTFTGFLLIQLAIVLHGIITKDFILVIGYALSMLSCGTVLILAVYYKSIPQPTKASELSLEEIIAQIPGHIYWKNKDGVSLGCNTNNWKDFGFNALSDFIGKNDSEIFSKEDAAHLEETDKKIITTGKAEVVEEIFSADEPILYLSHKAPLRNKANEIIGIIGNSVDITITKRNTEDRLNMLENIIAIMPGHVYWVNRDNMYLGCNDNQAISSRLKNRQEIVGKYNKDLPWNRSSEALVASLDKINNDVMLSGKAITIEEPGILPDGTKARFLSTKVPMRDSNNKVIGMVGISMDITERILALEREQQAIIAADEERVKAESEAEIRRAVTILAGSIAHDLRTLLTSMSLTIDLFKKMYSSSSNNLINPITPESIDPFLIKMKKLVNDMSEFINNTLKSIQNLVSDSLSPDDFIACEIEDCLYETLAKYPFQDEEKQLVHLNNINNFTILCYPVLFYRILFNLIANSLQQIRLNNHGKILISTESNEQHNLLYFRDTAGGASPEIVAKIFEGFNTTKQEGTGVGLAFCKLTMQSFGGDIVCHSVEGDYIEFILSFPRLV